MASELVTNSVTHSAGPDGAFIRLVLTIDQGELAILVRDDHPGIPMAGQPGEDDEDGRGLLIVEYLSDRCGWYPLEDAKPAKVTWAVVSGPAMPTADCPQGSTQRSPRCRAGNQGAARPGAAGQAASDTAPASGMRAPRPVDPAILARVKAALERL